MMLFKFPYYLKNVFKKTQFWKDNYLIFQELKSVSNIALLALLFTFLAAIFEGFGVGFLLTFLQSLTEPDYQPIQTGIDWFDVWILGVKASANERIYRISILILIVTLLRTGMTYLSEVYSGLTQSNLAYQLRVRLFEQFQSLSLSYFTKVRSGELINSITAEIGQLMQAFSLFSFMLVRGSTLLVYVVSMMLLSLQLTILSILLFTLLTIGVSTLIKKVREISFERTKARGLYTSIAIEFINGINTVQASAAENFERKRFYKASENLLKSDNKSFVFSASVVPISEAVATLILIGMLLFSFAFLIPTDQLKIASLLTFIFILFRLIPITRQLNGARTQISSFQGSINNINELLRTDNKTYLKNGTSPYTHLQQKIVFQSVSFGYDQEDVILHDINLIIKRGEMTALVGASGAGKTTLANLIPRFYDVTQGQILIDDLDLREFDVYSLRRRMAVVSQDTFIFNTSVRDNIAYALENVEEEAVAEAARFANALDFIQELPQGMDTILGDRGVRLSGGQRQRIAIARAILRDPDILILDEATSALDSVSERLIQESMQKLAVGRTVIAIAHRLSTIVRANKVVVLEQGRIVEEGGYQELLELRGKLWKYHQMQHDLSQVS
ncbi:heterocyst formation ABC transporter subunit HepA [Limnoraphis robusta Tam1]|uniref:Heterocyst formation ABC transporter subunit HepA n=1 Tax=Limnoraphis robusta CCNP1315 TaxID=3110306 RepID=A0ABU5TUK5_9CYAN|nr:heterocyst formation ABC transporter subunit HepA [Limnoraphis robusta]MEA5499840.1 heterocyst formation ABC transporter subunit HepA [Limnoraphis robusta BA-68 BA1]MEA5518582.1 heterocyst formation ABC transporter subunit HepA [Limnoraphis robusta CCNP1315]MEA5538688.1 heterocyst formation ABC transporter subunit HepA [Limnoraphis robusta Tam1]MEA5548023.1 heterocyst formation ABC transporter subunit HepA [Limnoraphis robusta CCNP1324]